MVGGTEEVVKNRERGRWQHLELEEVGVEQQAVAEDLMEVRRGHQQRAVDPSPQKMVDRRTQQRDAVHRCRPLE